LTQKLEKLRIEADSNLTRAEHAETEAKDLKSQLNQQEAVNKLNLDDPQSQQQSYSVARRSG
jgi:hypothetical protein